MLLAWLPLPSQAQAEDNTTQDLAAQLASFQQKLDTAYAEAQQEEAQREAALNAQQEAGLRVFAIVAEGGGENPADMLRARVERKMEPEKMTLKEHVEKLVGMCLVEIVIGLNPLPHFSMTLRSKRPDEVC